MFSGGTNFGFMGGGNYGTSYSPRAGVNYARYIPHTTSYSEDTMIGEGGELTEKYFLCRDVLDEYMGREKRPHIYNEHPTQALTVELTEAAKLFDNLDALTERHEHSPAPKPMEYYDQNYGLILYTTKIDGFQLYPITLQPYKYKDRANMYIDNEFYATFLRDRGATRIADGVPKVGQTPAILQDGNEKKIDILVENMGRINFGRQITDERKGMEDCIIYSGAKLFGYDTRTLPLEDLSRLEWKENSFDEHKPCFFKGSFDAKSGIDTYISFENFDHGYIWVNGFNVGRYDSAGPQMTLYLPGHFLKETDNEIIVLDIDPHGERKIVNFLDHEILEGDGKELT
jgi:beta-galactosidase